VGPAFGVNKPDPAQATPTAVRTGHRFERFEFGQPRGCFLTALLQQSASAWDILLPEVVAQDAVVPDADQTGRQNVMSEAAKELVRAQGEGFDLATVTVIAPSKSDGLGLLINRHNAPVA
jgi:hypothetical protein